MAFQLLKKLFTEILVKPVLNGLKASYAPGSRFNLLNKHFGFIDDYMACKETFPGRGLYF